MASNLAHPAQSQQNSSDLAPSTKVDYTIYSPLRWLAWGHPAPPPALPNESIHQASGGFCKNLFFFFFRFPSASHPQGPTSPEDNRGANRKPFLVRQHAGTVPFIIRHPLIPVGLISVDGLGGFNATHVNSPKT